MALVNGLTAAQIASAAGGATVSNPLPSAGMQSYRVFNRSGLTVYVSDEFNNQLAIVQPYVEKQGECQIPSRSLILSTHAGDPVIQSNSYVPASWLVNAIKAGVPSDADFAATPPDGTMALNTSDSKLYIRIGGTWKKTAALT